MAKAEDARKHRERQWRRRRALMSHPLRRRICRLLLDGRETGADEVAAELEESADKIAYHLRLLFRREVLEAVPKCRPAPPCFRWSPEAQWARKLLDESDR
ncbi:MAG: helix-turn-helix domain-containing protein [Solirubrobacterales bacterium]